MRINLAGYHGINKSLVLELTNGVPFSPAEYIANGFNKYEVVCIGAAGGFGGGMNTEGVGVGESQKRPFGGAPGGGGIHRVQGFLVALPDSCPVVVGTAGDNAPNVYILADVDDLVAGENGGNTSFNGATCRASGGSGGEPALYHTGPFVPFFTGGLGGPGGLGNSNTAGAANNATGSDRDGSWNDYIGAGGGGGDGGVGVWDDSSIEAEPSSGGIGVYSLGHVTFYGPAGEPAQAPGNDEFEPSRIDIGQAIGDALVPGAGGGAKLTPITTFDTVYGSKVTDCTPDGAIFIHLTAF